MTMPTISAVHVDKLLSNYSVAPPSNSFVAHIMAPTVDTDDESGIYYVHGWESFYPEDDLRRPGAWANKVRFNLSRATYTQEEYALAEDIPDRIVNQQDNILNLRKEMVDLVKAKVLLNKEIRVRDILYTSGGFTSVTLTTGAGNKWSNYTSATSSPLEVIKTAKSTIRRALWKDPTHIFIPPSVAEVLADHPDILALRKETDSSLLINGELPPYIRGLKVVTPTAGYTASEIDTTPSEVWGNNVVVMYINEKPGKKTMNTLQTFSKRRGRVRKWYDYIGEAENIEFSMICGEEVICVGGAYVIKETI